MSELYAANPRFTANDISTDIIGIVQKSDLCIDDGNDIRPEMKLVSCGIRMEPVAFLLVLRKVVKNTL